MTDRYQGQIEKCPRHGYHAAGRPCPLCPKTANKAILAAIDSDPHQDTGKNQITAEHTPLAAEAQIQRQVEEWLHHAGYWPRSPKYLDGSRPPRGWYVHVHQAKGNPILLDLLILDFARGWYEIELKTATGRLRAAQADIIAAQPEHSCICRAAQDAIDAIRQRFEMA